MALPVLPCAESFDVVTRGGLAARRNFEPHGWTIDVVLAQCHLGQVDLDLTDFWPTAVTLNDMDGPAMLF
jgi:hypothetical protein